MTSIAQALEKDMVSTRCRFSLLRDEIYGLDSGDGVAVDAAIRSGLTCNKIAKAIRAGGYRISHSTIQAHKDNTCMCKGDNRWV